MNWTTYNSAGAALSQSLTDMPVGTITGYAGTTAPSGWLLCDGSAVSRSDYAELFGVVSTTYGSGNGSTTFNVPDSSGFIILASSQAARLAAAALPQYVTSLPSSPVDGQTVVYAADASNGVMWTLRYRAASSSSYKWEAIGGPPLTHTVATSQTTSSQSNVDLTTVGPTVTVPLKGDYLVHGRSAIRNDTNGYYATVEIVNNGVAQGYIAYAKMAAASQELTASTDVKTEVTTAAHVVKLQYRVGAGGTATFFDRFISVSPIRVG